MDDKDHLDGCLQAFLARDYAGCTQRILALFPEPEGSPISRAPPLEALQVLLLSLQRLGQLEALEELAPDILAGAAHDPWRHTLLALTLGRSTLKEASTLANGPAAVCAASAYAGARAISTGLPLQARTALEAALQAGADCWEARLARAELEGLKHGDPEALEVEGRDPDEVVRALLAGAGEASQAGTYQQAAALLARGRYLAYEHLGRAAAVGLTPALAGLHVKMGEHALAERQLRWALGVMEELAGPEDSVLADPLNVLAQIHLARNEPEAARTCLARSLQLQHQVDPHDRASALLSLSGVHVQLAELDDAQVCLEQALDILRRAAGESDPATASARNSLGALLLARAEHARALPLLRQALAARIAALGPAHPETARTLVNLGKLHAELNDLQGAEPLFQQAFEVCQRALGPAHTLTTACLGHLGGLAQAAGSHARAIRYYGQAVERLRSCVAADHPDLASALHNLAHAHTCAGDHEAARRLYAESLRGQQAGPRRARTLACLGALLLESGKPEQAEDVLRQAAALQEASGGPDHPDLAVTVARQAIVLAATGRPGPALELLRRQARRDERVLAQVFALTSERQRLSWLAGLRWGMELFLSLACPATSTSAVPSGPREAFELVLRRKGLLTETTASQREPVLAGRYPHLSDRLRDLASVRARVAHLLLAGPEGRGPAAQREQLARWSARREQIEAALVGEIPASALRQRPLVELPALAATLPAGSALVEFVRTRTFAPGTASGGGWGPARYLAFVLPAGEGRRVRVIDLGAADVVDSLVAGFRAAVQRAGHGPGEELRQRVFDPLVDALGGRTRLFLAPDGELSRLPFEALPCPEGFVLDRYHVSYLTTGSDLLRFREPALPAARPVVAADPDFDLAGLCSAGQAATPWRCAPDLPRGQLRFDRLPGSREEGARVADLLGVGPWLGGEDEPLESRIKGVCAPRILHLATHGFFLADAPRPANVGQAFQPDARQSQAGKPDLRSGARDAGNPLLRSGLALSGANTWLAGQVVPEGAEDGLLTAEDVAGLDLLGTRLVVLSACEAGLPQGPSGEGVFGLRRAFVEAGARALVMSLWKAPEDSAILLMQGFYTRLLSGAGVSEALREAQHDLKRRRPEPCYWAGFICQGDPGPLGAGGA